MLTSILSAVCALTLSTSAVSSQADTMNVYMVNGEKVVNFDGSQLVGKTISDYKTMTASSISNGEVTVTKVHMIRTDGKQSENASMSQSSKIVDGTSVNTFSVNEGPREIAGTVSVKGSDPAIVIINGKESTREELTKMNPRRIAELQIYKAGTQEALKWTKDKTMNVITVETK